MSYIPFRDISYAQGLYNMATNPDPIIVIKMSGGDAGLYYDSQAARNYNNAVVAHKAIGLYHFYGGGDPTTEADFFIKACSPLAEGDVLILDIERGATWNPQTDPGAVAKVAAMAKHIHDRTGVWPWVYMNMSTANMYDWSPVFNFCGYWCAAPSYGFDATLPVKYPQIAQQGPIVGGVDTDAFFGTLAQFKAYGYHQSPAPSPAPIPVPAPIPSSTTTTTTTTTSTTTTTLPPADWGQENNSLLKQILALLQGLVTKIGSIFK